MIKTKIKEICKKNKFLYRCVYNPYSLFCEKKRVRNINENFYHLNDPTVCLNGLCRNDGLNFWFLLEQGHNNIGDIAIGIAERQFFEKYFHDIPKHYIYEVVFDRYKREVYKQIRPGDVIILRGGGSIGNTVMHEKHREEIIKKYKENLIVSMPQTMSFPETKKGRKEKKRAIRIYDKHPNLLLIAREEKTYLDMKTAFAKTNVILTPDIVMSLDCQKPKMLRDGILLCFRSDWEKRISDEDVNLIYDKCIDFSSNISRTDMYSEDQFVPFEQREVVFQNKINEFKRASLVITDRLHGMVFSAISGTPCIALSNYNHKVSETYKWLRDLPYIKFCNTAEETIECIPQLYNFADTNYNNDFTAPYYGKIVNYINDYLNSL